MTADQTKSPPRRSKNQEQAGKKTIKKKKSFFPIRLPFPVLAGGVTVVLLSLFLILGGGAGQPRSAGAPSSEPVSQQTSAASQSSETTKGQEQETGAASIPYAPVTEQELLPETDLPIIERQIDKIPTISRKVEMTKEQFYAKSQEYTLDELQGDKFLSFIIRLPQGWARVTEADLNQMQLSNRLLGVVAYFVSPSNMEQRSSLRIKAQKLAHMVTARDWLFQYAQSNRYTLQALGNTGNDRAEGVYIVQDMEVSYAVRVAVILNGPRVLVAEYYVPLNVYDSEKDMQIWTISSFYQKFKDMTPGEPMRRLNFVDIAAFDYPASWQTQRTDIVTIDRMSTSIVNLRLENAVDKKSILQGRIDVFLFAANDDYTPDKIFQKIGEQLKFDNLVIGDQLGKFRDMLNDNHLQGESYSVFKINDINNSYQDYQYWVAVLKGKNYRFYVCLLNPPSLFDSYNWSRNLTAYEYVIKTLREGA